MARPGLVSMLRIYTKMLFGLKNDEMEHHLEKLILEVGIYAKKKDKDFDEFVGNLLFAYKQFCFTLKVF